MKAQGLAIAATVVLLIYATDAATKEAGTDGFLKIDTITRGAVFGGSAVVLSTAAFFVSTRQRSLLVSALLIVNGIVMTVGGIMATESYFNQCSSWSVCLFQCWIMGSQPGDCEKQTVES
jgi:hypothetical protein